MRKKFPGFST